MSPSSVFGGLPSTHPSSLPPSLLPFPLPQAFKFIVDDEWRFAPDQLTVADVEGRINNFIDVTHFKPFNEDSSTLDIARKEEELYGTTYPDVEEYSVKEPPPLPPHLRHIILNKVKGEREDGMEGREGWWTRGRNRNKEQGVKEETYFYLPTI